MKSTTDARLRSHFLGWQCRLRQHCMRQDGGRPSTGMRPRVSSQAGNVLAAGITTIMVPADTREPLAFFRFQVQRTNDPRQAYEAGLRYLQSTYYQVPDDFSDELAAVFPQGSALGKRLLAENELILDFDQAMQTYRMLARVRRLQARGADRELILWHNRLFNPEVPTAALVLGLQPQWDSAQAHPMP